MFRLMCFFMSFHHQLHQAAVKEAAGAGRKGADLPKFELGHVLETMDLMSFNLVLKGVETAIAEKNIKHLAECVAVWKEMMHIVVRRYIDRRAADRGRTCGGVYNEFSRFASSLGRAVCFSTLDGVQCSAFVTNFIKRHQQTIRLRVFIVHV